MNPFYFDRSLKDYEKEDLRKQEKKIKERQKEVKVVEEVVAEKVRENNSIIKKRKEVEAKIEKELKDFDRKIKERKMELEEEWKSDILEEFDREEREKITKEITSEVEKKFYKEAVNFINQGEFEKKVMPLKTDFAITHDEFRRLKRILLKTEEEK